MSLPPHSQQRLLIADDDLEVRQGVAELLADLGLEIVEAGTGTEAIELVRRNRIHAALLDMHMPGCSGIEAIPLLRLERADLRCIVYSGRWSPDLELEALAQGAIACLKKPVEPLTLRRTVCTALGRPFDPRYPNN